MTSGVGRSATDRSYLSIREVLDLLVDEFPDVTISKIRYLESRGLIHPERTASGYRKFYDHDVERLRWILGQQREHFLPLKVIKGRLENSPAPSLFDADALIGEPVPDHRPAGGEAGVTPPPPSAPLAAPAPRPRPTIAPAPFAEPPRPEPLVPRRASLEQQLVAPVASTAGSAPPEPAVTRQAPARPASDAPPTGPSEAPLAGFRFSAEELAGACGTDAGLVEELEEFGLVTGRTVAGVRVYDGEDLAIVRLAAGLGRFGIEARHLRVFKHAADREASLFAQVVTPLLRQRNPAARARAEQDLAELTELGTELQAVFLRTVLRELTGG